MHRSRRVEGHDRDVLALIIATGGTPGWIARCAAGMAHLFRCNLQAGCHLINFRHVSDHCWSRMQDTRNCRTERWPGSVRDRIE